MRFTVKTKLIGGFFIILALLTISSVISIIRLSELSGRLDHIVDLSAKSANLSNKINQYLSEINEDEKNIILASSAEEKDKYLKNIEKNSGEHGENSKRIEMDSEEKGKDDDDGFEKY